MTAPLFQAPEDWRTIQGRERAAWSERYNLQPSAASHLCLRWIATRGRCRRYCDKPGSWWDHPSAWVDSAKRPTVVLLQPYGFELKYLDVSRALIPYPQVYLRFERDGWHHPSTSLVEIWRDEETYRSAK